ncbi:divalent-cation tolerance protein CutA [Candidatus Micrarchaeota archaeon]|nr:divalent-cation tolerance protein CutA [Candidatus Micrarchaeota archaeon]MBU1165865.1 divalent-cation tolerance protein CutA [Candidatus Micrarchaeota archaeon]MBU1886366.1 divalent-cation tolerance protein CutA [Candidatus Micrarchaeota archaeon]
MIIVLSTYPDKEKAEAVALTIVENELAACVNIIKIENSIYRWKGEIKNNPEYLLLIKTTKKAYSQLEMLLKESHPYETPEIVSLEIKHTEKNYAKWVDSVVLSRLLRVPLDLSATRRASVPSNELTKAKKPSTLSR